MTELTENAVFAPRILAFLCNWCSYAASDKAGMAQQAQSPHVRVVRVMCTGRIDPQFVLHAFRKGADGVVLLGCHLGDCHYKEGNVHAVKRHHLLLRLLQDLGIDGRRCRMDFVSAGEGDRYVRILADVVEQVRELGPMGFSEQIG